MYRYFLFALLAGCASQGVAERSMSADEHRQAADKHNADGDLHADEGQNALTSPADPLYNLDTYDPDTYHKLEASRHRELGKQHAAAALKLEVYEEAQCGEFPKSTRVKCPLMGSVVTATDIENGVEITLSEGANVSAIADHVRCHHAFAQVQGREGMDTCPMYVDGFVVERVGDKLRMTTDEANTPELRKRAKAHTN